MQSNMPDPNNHIGHLICGLLKGKLNIFYIFKTMTHYLASLFAVKLVYKGNPRDPKKVTVVDGWSLFRGSFVLLKLKTGSHHGGRYRQVVASTGLYLIVF